MRPYPAPIISACKAQKHPGRLGWLIVSGVPRKFWRGAGLGRKSVTILLTLMIAGCSLVPRPPSSHPGTTPPAPATGTGGSGPIVIPPEPPTATPAPIVRVSAGDKSLFNGDIDSAMLQYRAAAKQTDDPDIRSASLWGLARAQYTDGRYYDAITTLDQLISEYPKSPYAAPANFLKGESLDGIHHFADAAAAYQAYLTGRPGVLDSYVQQLRGDDLTQAGQFADALVAYNAAQAAPHLADAHALEIKVAQAHASVGEYDTAISMVDAIAANTSNDFIRAQMDFLAGQAYISQGKNDLGYERFRHAVSNYPVSNYSYQALVQLLGAGIAVDDLDRGLVDYFAGQYDVALEYLNRSIAANPAEDGTAHYYRAYALEDLQQYQQAVDAFTSFIQNYPSHPKWVDAWEEKAFLQWYRLNLYPQAAQTLLNYVAAEPASAQAPDELMSAARIYERDGRFDDAAKTWQRLADAYPSNAQAPTAVFFAGLMQYRQSDYSAALPLFERSLVLSTQPEDQARAYLWIGKTHQKLGDKTGGQNAWQQGQLADPGGYYSQRSSDLLMGALPFSPPAATNFQPDMAAERKAADAWVRLTFKLPAGTDLSGLGALVSDPRLIRGRELWNLGFDDEARLEFEDLRCDLATQGGLDCASLARVTSAAALSEADTGRIAVETYALANYLLEIGLYRSGVYATRQVLSLAGLASQAQTMLAPPYFNHVRYGLYFSELIIPAAHQNGLDPLFLFSVVRQESLFEGFVRSTAGARGLMQIVPSTGGGIAAALGWPINYDADKLYRPNVSVAFGAYYLASNRSAVGGDLYTALAAYNAGLGNALDWKKLGQDDPDLLLESIRFEESRQYIRSIYEMYIIYRRLYGSGS
ncbi:MAG TPA: transglycosylase SLT domain-containing protein [Anaerolineales bacterium]